MAISENELKAFLGRPEFLDLKNVTKKMLAILSVVHDQVGEDFSKLLIIQRGKTKIFCNKFADVRQLDDRQKFSEIPGSNFWVATKMDTKDKHKVISTALGMLGYGASVVETVVNSLS